MPDTNHFTTAPEQGPGQVEPPPVTEREIPGPYDNVPLNRLNLEPRPVSDAAPPGLYESPNAPLGRVEPPPVMDQGSPARFDPQDAVLGRVEPASVVDRGTPAQFAPQNSPGDLSGGPAEFDPRSASEDSGGAPAQYDPQGEGSSSTDPAGETGAGIYEDYDSQVAALEDEAAAEVEQLAGAPASGEGDPLSMLVGAGVGWLLEHVSFLREPLDVLAGDMAAIQAQVDQLVQHASDLMTIANEHGQQMTEAQDWTGQAADAFHSSMDRLGGELASMSAAVEGTANITAGAGEMLMAVRDTVADLITQLVTQLVTGAVVAMAWSPMTFGASVVTFIGVAVVEAAAVTATNVAQIQELLAALQRQGDRVAQLGDMNEEIATGMDRFAAAAGA